MDLLGYWNLRERPFEATWDTRFFFQSRDIIRNARFNTGNGVKIAINTALFTEGNVNVNPGGLHKNIHRLRRFHGFTVNSEHRWALGGVPCLFLRYLCNLRILSC